MRGLSLLFLAVSLVVYLLAILAKFNVLNFTTTMPVSLIAFAGLNALVAVVFGILSIGSCK
ncbi:MAG: hypothetical protein ABIH66_03215 [bacterium]